MFTQQFGVFVSKTVTKDKIQHSINGWTLCLKYSITFGRWKPKQKFDRISNFHSFEYIVDNQTLGKRLRKSSSQVFFAILPSTFGDFSIQLIQ